MKLPPIPLFALLLLYILFSVLALGRLILTSDADIFTLGVIPVLIGILLRRFWSLWVLRVYVALQTLGCAALGVTALLATQISPDEARLFIGNTELPLALVALVIALLLAFQWWVAFNHTTRCYLNPSQLSESNQAL